MNTKCIGTHTPPSSNSRGWESFALFLRTLLLFMSFTANQFSVFCFCFKHAVGEHGEKYMPNMTSLLNPKFLSSKPMILGCRCTWKSPKKLFLKCFYFREKGERETSMLKIIDWLLHTPHWWSSLQPRHVPLTGLEPHQKWVVIITKVYIVLTI